jgi:hypothetical protein
MIVRIHAELFFRHQLNTHSGVKIFGLDPVVAADDQGLSASLAAMASNVFSFSRKV